MGDLSYDDIKTEIKVKLSQRDDIDVVIQNAIFNAYQDIATIFHHYELETSGNVTLVVGQRSYDLATLLPALRVILSVRNTTLGKKITKTDWRVFDEMSSYSSGPPSRYARFGDTLEFDTLPATAHVVAVKYAKKVTAFSGSSKSVLLPEWDEAILLGSIYRVLERIDENDKAEVAKNRYLEFVQSRTRPKDLEDEDIDEPLGLRFQ